MKLRFTRQATDDIAAIAGYIRERNPVAAVRVRAAIYASLQNLILFPRAGRLQKNQGGAQTRDPSLRVHRLLCD